jgi:hypothetical protein
MGHSPSDTIVHGTDNPHGQLFMCIKYHSLIAATAQSPFVLSPSVYSYLAAASELNNTKQTSDHLERWFFAMLSVGDLPCIRVSFHRLCVTEHMEEDDHTPRAIPPWVELEYAVGTVTHIER